MGDTVRKVSYFYIKAANKPGEGAKILGKLRDVGVNLLALSGFPAGRQAQIDFIPEDPAWFQEVAKRTGLKLSAKKSGFLIQGIT